MIAAGEAVLSADAGSGKGCGRSRERQTNRFTSSPALGELFVCLDQGSIDADLVAHVREYLQDEENGVKRAYRPLRLVG